MCVSIGCVSSFVAFFELVLFFELDFFFASLSRFLKLDFFLRCLTAIHRQPRCLTAIHRDMLGLTAIHRGKLFRPFYDPPGVLTGFLRRRLLSLLLDLFQIRPHLLHNFSPAEFPTLSIYMRRLAAAADVLARQGWPGGRDTHPSLAARCSSRSSA